MKTFHPCRRVISSTSIVSTILDGVISLMTFPYVHDRRSYSDRAKTSGACYRRMCRGLGLAAANRWGHSGEILQDAINTHAQANGYSVVVDIGGHGIGLEFHEDPFVSYVTPKGSEMLLVPGMMFTIEPMINEGSPDFFVDEDNDWTIYTIDDGLSAQIEYMVLVKEDGIEILTK